MNMSELKRSSPVTLPTPATPPTYTRSSRFEMESAFLENTVVGLLARVERTAPVPARKVSKPDVPPPNPNAVRVVARVEKSGPVAGPVGLGGAPNIKLPPPRSSIDELDGTRIRTLPE